MASTELTSTAQTPLFFKITIDGSKVIDHTSFHLSELIVCLKLDAASYCTFKLVNAYDAVARAFQADLRDVAKFGDRIVVQLGDEDSRQPVFDGYLHSIRAEFDETPVLVFTAMDVRRFMMEGVRRKEYKSMKYRDIVSGILSEYGVTGEVQVDDPGDQLELVTQNGTDWQLLQEIALRSGCCMYVENGKFLFKPAGFKDCPVTLTWNENLISFHRELIWKKLDVCVTAYDHAKMTQVSATQKVDSGKSPSYPGSARQIVVAVPGSVTQSEARARAKSEKLREESGAQIAGGKCPLMPQLHPGMWLTVNGLDSTMNMKYCVTSVRHVIGTGLGAPEQEDAGGETATEAGSIGDIYTEFECGGWKS